MMGVLGRVSLYPCMYSPFMNIFQNTLQCRRCVLIGTQKFFSDITKSRNSKTDLTNAPLSQSSIQFIWDEPTRPTSKVTPKSTLNAVGVKWIKDISEATPEHHNIYKRATINSSRTDRVAQVSRALGSLSRTVPKNEISFWQGIKLSLPSPLKNGRSDKIDVAAAWTEELEALLLSSDQGDQAVVEEASQDTHLNTKRKSLVPERHLSPTDLLWRRSEIKNALKETREVTERQSVLRGLFDSKKRSFSTSTSIGLTRASLNSSIEPSGRHFSSTESSDAQKKSSSIDSSSTPTVKFQFNQTKLSNKIQTPNKLMNDPSERSGQSITRFLDVKEKKKSRIRLLDKETLIQLQTNLIITKRKRLNQETYILPSSTDGSSGGLSSFLRIWPKERTSQSMSNLSSCLTPDTPEIKSSTSFVKRFSSFSSTKRSDPHLRQIQDTTANQPQQKGNRNVRSNNLAANHPLRNEIRYIAHSYIKPPRSIRVLQEDEKFKAETVEVRKRFGRIRESGIQVDDVAVSLLLPFYGNSIVRLVAGIAHHTDEQISKKIQEIHLQRGFQPNGNPIDIMESNTTEVPFLEVSGVGADALRRLQKVQEIKGLKNVGNSNGNADNDCIPFSSGVEEWPVKKEETFSLPEWNEKSTEDKEPTFFRSQLTKLTSEPTINEVTSNAMKEKHTEILIRQGVLLDRRRITVGALALHLGADEDDVMTLGEILLDKIPMKDTPLTMDEADLIASELGLENKLKYTDEDSEENREKQLVSRSPVIAIIGHVDHGKTSLLDLLRKSSVAKGEAGKITQSVAAFEVRTRLTNTLLTFIDTPGHATFHTMRRRDGTFTGVRMADVAVLIVAADEGIKPQTIEAYDAARAVRVPLIIAINKIDKKTVDVERTENEIRSALSINPEEERIVRISAKTGENLEQLEEALAELKQKLDLKADLNARRPSAFILEARNGVDGHSGMLYSCIMQQGQLKIGSPVFVGCQSGHIVRFFNSVDHQTLIDSPRPGQPFDVAVRYPHNSSAISNVEGKSSGAGEMLVQLPSSKEWRQLCRFYELRNAALAESLSSNRALAAGERQREDFIQKFRERIQKMEFSVKSGKGKWLRSKTGKLEANASATRQSMLDSNLSRYERFIAASSHPQLHISLATKDDGAMEAIMGWIDEFNDEKKNLFEAQDFSELPKDVQEKGQTEWKRKTQFDFLRVPLPIIVTSTTLGVPLRSAVDRARDLGHVIILFGLNQLPEAQRLERDSELKIRSHDVIYAVFKDIEILYNYHFGPTVARKICATGGPVTSTCGFSLDGKKCRIATVSLSSGSVEVKNCVIDVRPRYLDQHRPQKIEKKGRNRSDQDQPILIASGVPVESFAVRQKPTMKVTAPNSLDIAVSETLVKFKEGDIIDWYKTEPVGPPFEDSRYLKKKDEFSF